MKSFFAKSLLAIAVAGASSAGFATEVQKIDYDTWNDPIVEYANGDRAIASNIWIDLAIESLGYDKDVSVIWTSNDWLTWHETTAFYEGMLEDGREKWGADILSVGQVSQRYYGTFWEHLYDVNSNEFEWLDGAPCNDITASCSVNIRFALRYIDLESGREFWDNNNGENYTAVVSGTLAE